MRRLLLLFFLLSPIFVFSQSRRTAATVIRNNTTDNAGLKYLRENAYFAYDFSNLNGTSGAAILSTDPGLKDLSYNSINLSTVNSPKVNDLAYNNSTTKSFFDETNKCLSTGISGAGIFNQSQVKIWMVFETDDGHPLAVATDLFGGSIPTNLGIQLSITTTGNLNVTYGNSDGVTTWHTGALFADAVGGVYFVEVDIDFTNDLMQVYVQGETTVTTQLSGTISSINPANWNNTSSLYIGSLDNNGTPTSNAATATGNFQFFAVTPFPTVNQINDVRNYILTRFMKWGNEIHIASTGDITTKRSDLISRLTNGTGLAHLSPSTTVTNYTGSMHESTSSSNILYWSTITKYTFVKTDVDGYLWTNTIFQIQSYNPNGIAIAVGQGHGGATQPNAEALMTLMLQDGYDVLWFAPPICSADNTETNPSITGINVIGHNQILSGGLDRAGYMALELFLFDVTSIIDYLDPSYTDFYLFGHSGSGWQATLLAAIEPRFSKSIIHRGSIPNSFKDNSDAHSQGDFDYEQYGMMLTSGNAGSRVWQLAKDHTFLDMYIMATSGGRKVRIDTHVQDPFFGGTSWYAWRDYINILCTSITGGTITYYINVIVGTEGSHSISLTDRQHDMDFFNN